MVSPPPRLPLLLLPLPLLPNRVFLGHAAGVAM
jgi:hypothetical protein